MRCLLYRETSCFDRTCCSLSNEGSPLPASNCRNKQELVIRASLGLKVAYQANVPVVQEDPNEILQFSVVLEEPTTEGEPVSLDEAVDGFLDV